MNGDGMEGTPPGKPESEMHSFHPLARQPAADIIESC